MTTFFLQNDGKVPDHMNILSAAEASKHVSVRLTYVNLTPIPASATEDIVGDGLFKG